MLKEFEEWLFQQCPWHYLLSREQEEEYFSQWFDEVSGKEKEGTRNDLGKQKHMGD